MKSLYQFWEDRRELPNWVRTQEWLEAEERVKDTKTQQDFCDAVTRLKELSDPQMVSLLYRQGKLRCIRKEARTDRRENEPIEVFVHDKGQ